MLLGIAQADLGDTAGTYLGRRFRCQQLRRVLTRWHELLKGLVMLQITDKYPAMLAHAVDMLCCGD